MAAAAIAVAAPGESAHSESLEQLLRENVEGNDRVISAQAEAEAARNRAREALGAWFPTLTPTFNFGWEQQNKPSGTADTSTGMREFDLKLSQLLWDFGATNAAVEKARLRLLQAEISLVGARQELMLEMAQAYVNLLRAEQVLAYARQSERNIQRQTGLEEARVEAGSGLSTDVLQAKTQLAGAEARRIQAEGALVSAVNRFRAVFGRSPPPAGAFEPVNLEDSRLPPDLDAAIRTADDSNVQLLQANLTEAIAREDVDETRSREFFPKVEGIVEQNYKRNVAGTLGSQNETLAKVELSMPINLGGTQVNKLRAAQSTLLARVRTVSDTRRRVEEQVRNAWDQLKTARATAASRRNQANIADAFLELARKERQLGQRSLIDVLSGETNLINAQSDAASAEADVLIAAYSLLRTLGRLDYDTFRAMPAAPGGGAPTAPASPASSETTGLSPRPQLPAEMRARLMIDRAGATQQRRPAEPGHALPLRPYRAPEPGALPAPTPPEAAPAGKVEREPALPPPAFFEPAATNEDEPRSSPMPPDAPQKRGAMTEAPAPAGAGAANGLEEIARGIGSALSGLFTALTEGGRSANAGAQQKVGSLLRSPATPKATLFLPDPPHSDEPSARQDSASVPSPPAAPPETVMTLPPGDAAPPNTSIGTADRQQALEDDDGVNASAQGINTAVPGVDSSWSFSSNPISRFFAAIFTHRRTPTQSTRQTARASIGLPASFNLEPATTVKTAVTDGSPASARTPVADPLARFVRAVFETRGPSAASEQAAQSPEPTSSEQTTRPQSAGISSTQRTSHLGTGASLSTSGSSPQAYQPDPNEPISRFFRSFIAAVIEDSPEERPAVASEKAPTSGRDVAMRSTPPSGPEPYRPNPNDPLLRLFRAVAGQSGPADTTKIEMAAQPAQSDSDPVGQFLSQIITAFAGSAPVTPPPAAH